METNEHQGKCFQLSFQLFIGVTFWYMSINVSSRNVALCSLSKLSYKTQWIKKQKNDTPTTVAFRDSWRPFRMRYGEQHAQCDAVTKIYLVNVTSYVIFCWLVIRIRCYVLTDCLNFPETPPSDFLLDCVFTNDDRNENIINSRNMIVSTKNSSVVSAYGFCGIRCGACTGSHDTVFLSLKVVKCYRLQYSVLQVCPTASSVLR